ncbi:acyltransferase [Spirosoma sp. KNUC1025]|uniref:acyltransferase family protein n=1 Tax=Spirosoma sp. KNUC1025 TaxID=2894082 RepID=UPI003868ACC3|nr:acyltransferase [Spirosoma sp. KNUC1025]
MNRIASLDGIRAVSILMVLLAHAQLSFPHFIAYHPAYDYIANSRLGVKIFFVISGYLITRLLMTEFAKTGQVSLKQFYIRRIFRIFPVFYLYILVVLLLKWYVVPDIFTNYSQVGVAALYLWNYKHLLIQNIPTDKGNWFFGHFWSLSMEEQFYLLWPISFIKLSRRTLIISTGLIIALMPFVRLATYQWMPSSRGQVSMMLQTGGDAVLIGCLGALLEKQLLSKQILKSKVVIILAALFIFVIDLYCSHRFGGKYSLTIGMSLTNVCILILLFWCIYVPSFVSRLLNSKLMIHIGILSYSLYIWQQLFLSHTTHAWVNKFPQNLVLVMVVAHISYYLIEKPTMSLRHYFSKKQVLTAPEAPLTAIPLTETKLPS